MIAEEWEKAIVSASEGVGTYRPEFASIVQTLASILEKRDQAELEYIESGSHPVVEHTNKGGATNVVKNPLLVVIMDLNTQALSYWRDLGLTPSGLRKLKEDSMKEVKSGLAEALNEILS